MSKIAIREATPEDAPWFAERLRESDRLEVIASSGSKNITALIASSISFGGANVAEVDGVPVAIFGAVAVSTVPSRAIPWMLGTDDLESHKRLLARTSAEVVSGWMEDYDHLVNYVDSRNQVSIDWLSWLGFDIHEAEPHGPFGQPFHRFQWTRGIHV